MEDTQIAMAYMCQKRLCVTAAETRECPPVLVPPDDLFFSTEGRTQNSTVPVPARCASLLLTFWGVVSL